jgi:hypothetical protein
MTAHCSVVKGLVRLLHPPHHMNDRTSGQEEVRYDGLHSAQAGEIHKKNLQSDQLEFQ